MAGEELDGAAAFLSGLSVGGDGNVTPEYHVDAFTPEAAAALSAFIQEFGGEIEVTHIKDPDTGEITGKVSVGGGRGWSRAWEAYMERRTDTPSQGNPSDN